MRAPRALRHAALGALLASALPAVAWAQSAGEEPPAPPAPATDPPAYPPPRTRGVPFKVIAEPAPETMPETAPETAPEGSAASRAPRDLAPKKVLDRFAGSYLDWGHKANTQFFGINSDSIGTEDLYYVMNFTLAPSFFAYRSERNQVRLSASIQSSMELTNSNTTTNAHELVFQDISLGLSDTISLLSLGGPSTARPGPAAAFNPTLEGGGEFNTWAIAGGGLIFPTSHYSAAIGRYLATWLSLGVRQRVKLLGSAAPALQSVTLSLTETWRHDFNRANLPSTSNPQVQQDFAGGVVASDVSSALALVENRLWTNVSLLLPIYAGLEASGAFSYRTDIKASLAQGCVQIATGCVSPDPSGPKAFSSTQFDVALSYRIVPEVVIDVGYENFASASSPNGSVASVFSSANSLFFADLALFPEAFLQRFENNRAPTAAVRPAE